MEPLTILERNRLPFADLLGFASLAPPERVQANGGSSPNSARRRRCCMAVGDGLRRYARRVRDDSEFKEGANTRRSNRRPISSRRHPSVAR